MTDEVSHVYDWPRCTIDNHVVLQPGGMPTGGVIALNGIDVFSKPICRLKTGSKGWIEYYAETIAAGEDGHLQREMLFGHVQYIL